MQGDWLVPRPWSHAKYDVQRIARGSSVFIIVVIPPPARLTRAKSRMFECDRHLPHRPVHTRLPSRLRVPEAATGILAAASHAFAASES